MGNAFSGGGTSSSGGGTAGVGGGTGGSLGGGEPDPNNPDNTVIDSDCDGLSDADEFGTVYPGGARTDPNNRDSDGDGISDGVEAGRTS